MRVKKFLFRLFAWTLLLGTAVGAFVAAIWLSEEPSLKDLPLVAHDPGPMANWAFSLLVAGISCEVWLLKGLDGGGWAVHGPTVASIMMMTLVLLLFGMASLPVIALAITMYTSHARKKAGHDATRI